MLKAGAQPLNVSRHSRWSDDSRSFAGYVEDATGFGDANPTKGLLLLQPRRPQISSSTSCNSGSQISADDHALANAAFHLAIGGADG